MPKITNSTEENPEQSQVVVTATKWLNLTSAAFAAGYWILKFFGKVP